MSDRPFGFDAKTGLLVMESEVAAHDGWIVRKGWVEIGAAGGRAFPLVEERRGEVVVHDFARASRRHHHYANAMHSRAVGPRPLP